MAQKIQNEKINASIGKSFPGDLIIFSGTIQPEIFLQVPHGNSACGNGGLPISCRS
jgi:hypothetical protein